MAGLISVEEALAAIRAHAPAWRRQTRPLADCLGARLAAPVAAKLTQPPLAVSAMDGYAVRLADVARAGTTLRVIGESPAGAPFGGPVGPGETVRIFTGGAVPAGADHIVIQENAARDGDVVTTVEDESAPRHVRAAGIDFRQGDVLIETGTVIGPAEIAVAAAANHAELNVQTPPSVAIIAAGDELKPPGADLAAGEIVSSNPVGLASLVRSWGGEAREMGVAADSVEAIQALIRAAGDADVLLPVGGASVGDRDHMRAAFAGLGADEVFAKVAVRPGKPTWLATLGRQVVLGLPGNPASAFVCAHLFLRSLLGLAPLEAQTAILSAPVEANGPRESYLRGVAEWRNGVLEVAPLPNQDSSLLTPFLRANVLIQRSPGAPAIGVGDVVEVVALN